MRFSAFSTLIVFVIFSGIGLVLIPQLNIQWLPDTQLTSVTIETYMPESHPLAMESLVTAPLEGAIARLPGITQIRSTSDYGSSRIFVSIDRWVDPISFRLEVASVIRRWHPLLPSGATFPTIALDEPTRESPQLPILSYSIYGVGDVREIAQFADKEIRARFHDIQGIQRIDIQKPSESQWIVNLDAFLQSKLNLSAEDVRLELSTYLNRKGIGRVDFENQSIPLYVQIDDSKVQDLLNYPLAKRDGRIILVGDIASIRRHDSAPNSIYRINGQQLLQVEFYPGKNVNMLEVSRQVRNRMEPGSWLPENMGITLQYDEADRLREELKNIYWRTILSVGLLLFFVVVITRQFRYLLIVVFALSANLLLSFILYVAFKVPIHVYSLAGITISLGLIVDNVIVVAEEIRNTGRNRVFAAILASTATASVALSIIFFLDESTRANLHDFAWAIVLNLLISLPIAYSLIPALIEKIPLEKRRDRTVFRRRRFLATFSHFYLRQLTFMLKFRRWFMACSLLLVVSPFVFFAHLFGKPSPLAPFQKNNGATQLQIHVSMPAGSTMTQMDDVVGQFEDYIDRYGQDIFLFSSRIFSGTEAFISVEFLKRHDPISPFRLKRGLEQKASLVGSADFDIHGVGPGFSNALNLYNFDSSIGLKGFNYPQLAQIAERIRDSLLINPRVQAVYIGPDPLWMRRNTFEHVLNLHEKGSLIASSVSPIQVQERVFGQSSSKLPIGATEENEPVFLRTSNQDALPLWRLKHQPLTIDDSSFVRLSALTSVGRQPVGDRIVRNNQNYVLFVSYRYLGSHLLNTMLQQHIQTTSRPWMPIGFDFHEQKKLGPSEDLDVELLWLLPLVLLLVYMVCAVLLESLTKALAVLTMIPFSFLGVFFMFYFLGLSFDVGGYASLLLLCGLTSNTALYIINDFNYLNKEKKQVLRIYIKAFHAKAMPILITTAAAVLSLIPFMIAGQEKGFWFTLSAGTIGGLLFSLAGVYGLLPVVLLKNPVTESKRRVK